MEFNTDLFIIGGGINGTAIAADAAGRGLSVMLCEKNDLGSGTSSCSSKLIHGGLRYLEFYEFGLVKKALHEREVLLFRAPNLVTPLEFILPHEKHLRPAWLIRIGLFLYDHLAKRNIIPRSKSVNLRKDIRGKELKTHLQKGFSYYDCFSDDARLVIANALSAKEHGATVLTRTEFISAKRENNQWNIQLKNSITEETFYCSAKVLLNVSGPWVKEIHKKIIGTDIQFEIELDKGSHIVVPKLYEGDFAYILQNSDQRIIFAIPYLEKYTLIGTTDITYNDTLDQVSISTEEEDYLCNIINQYFNQSISKKDIIWSYAGVRCLQTQDGQHQHTAATASRDFKYLIEDKDHAPLFIVIGGKLTTHRTLAEHALDQLKPFFPNMKSSWTATTPLPGGDISNRDFNAFYLTFKRQFNWLPDELSYRYAKNYGTRAYELLKDSRSLTDLGIHFSNSLYQKEVEFLIQHEWAISAEDILWRRTKLGLYFSDNEIANLQQWLQSYFNKNAY